MAVECCIPVIPSEDLEKSLRLWIEGLEFSIHSEMRKEGRLINCMLSKGHMWFMLNQRAGNPVKPEDYNGINLYWTPKDIHETRERLKNRGYGVSELEERDYGQTEFFLTDDDGFSHCFGVATERLKSTATEPELQTSNESKRALVRILQGGFFLRKKPLEGLAPGYTCSDFAVTAPS